MTYLVTGGAGFIGSNFVYYMLDKHPQDKIICVDAFTYAANPHTLNPALENPDVVVNFAAESHVDRSIENPGIFL